MTTEADPAAGTPTTRATISDVARVSGVSTTTVSHVLTGKRPVAASTRERVEAAVAQLHYRPSRLARSLRVGSSQMIGVVVPDITNPFYGQVTRGLSDSLGAEYGTWVCNTDGSTKRERAYVSDMVARGADALLITSVDAEDEAVAAALAAGVPTVSLGESVDHPLVDRVLAADEEASQAAVEHLLARGARRVAIIEGPRTLGHSREEGYEAALRTAGLKAPQQLRVHGDWTRVGGREAMLRLMRLPQRPDAVFCANDLMAIGALDALRSLGLRAPDDVRLVGFDDIEAASLVSPALTTIANPAYETGWSAAKLVLDRLQGRHTGSRRTVTLPCRLIVRETS
ncbi:LacI family DNA-binding transcriptional regulator [Microlunatus flavus]|uniref:LacI family transcriptional regulator n=1 Tax=Microlunatus flavus TaxID=1036181 RepID=A0A1H9JIL3_9ACTN|nr:LacI family DNA-binding transcriptional regulator [Microlunatus flavus]SEQ86395.1 LacI family transcriptional regulator [Microlunatus flavus]